MSSVHCVVVWEWQRLTPEGCEWVPHGAGVTRTLERAHGKQLTRVVLADADPALAGHYVNLRTLTQYCDNGDGPARECPVRRACYPLNAVAARGARWEWARLQPAQAQRDLCFEVLPMDMQCLLEEAWAAGAVVALAGWVACTARLVARAAAPPHALRLLRRKPQPPYPRARVDTHSPPPAARRARIPQQHTGSSVQSVQSSASAQSAPAQSAPAQSAPAQSHAQSQQPRAGARSASPRERKPGLARQILHNLNIFSHNNSSNKQPSPEKREKWASETRECERDRNTGTDTECGSTRSGRRHSVDTVSTYLSHESKDSLQQGSVGSLLNCSAGSDEVFEPAPPPHPPAPSDDSDTSLGALGAYLSVVSCPQWGAVCPACLRALSPGAAPPGGSAAPGGPAPPPPGPAVALTSCQHMMHLHCLNTQLAESATRGEPLHIECLVCGLVYGSRARGRGAGGEAQGEQPPGSMAWRLQPARLHTHPDCATILVTYNFQSGRQGPRHPSPGAPYYAVGFPRHTVLPDTPLGRQVLSALRSAWDRRLLFVVTTSATTGTEHVVSWRAPPAPPPAAALYHALTTDQADRMLRGLRDRLLEMTL